VIGGGIGTGVCLLKGGSLYQQNIIIAIKYEIVWLSELLLCDYCQILLEPVPEEDLVYTVETSLIMFSVLMESNQCFQMLLRHRNTMSR
jgi:hypothetical protein